MGVLLWQPRFGFTFSFQDRPGPHFDGHLWLLLIRILISNENYVKYNYFFVMIMSSKTWHCYFENFHSLAQDKLLASRVMISCSHSSFIRHDDVIKWKHFPRNWPFVREIHRSPVNFPHKGQWRGALMFSLIYAWINDWVNNREAGDLRRQHGHYDVIVMVAMIMSWHKNTTGVTSTLWGKFIGHWLILLTKGSVMCSFDFLC